MESSKPTEANKFDAIELGERMREIRENLGYGLEKVASDLRIRATYLEAIEAGHFNELPGNAYVVGFLRVYSDYLGLDGQDVVHQFKMADTDITNRTELHLPSPLEDGRDSDCPDLSDRNYYGCLCHHRMELLIVSKKSFGANRVSITR